MMSSRHVRSASISAGVACERSPNRYGIGGGPGHRRVYDAKREAERDARPDAPLFALEEVP